MLFFKKKKSKTAEQNYEDRELVMANSKFVEVLLVLTDDATLKADLTKLQDELKYLTASAKKQVLDYDTKIKNLLDDMRIELKKGNADKTAKMVGDVRELIALRNTQI